MELSFDGGLKNASTLLKNFETGRGVSAEFVRFLRTAQRTLPDMHYVLFSGHVCGEGVADAPFSLSLRECTGGFTVSVSGYEGMPRKAIQEHIEVVLRLRTPLLFDPKRSSIIVSIPFDLIEGIHPLPNFTYAYFCTGTERAGGAWVEHCRIEYHLVQGRTTFGTTVIIVENGFRELAERFAHEVSEQLPHWNVGHSDSRSDDECSILHRAWEWKRSDVRFVR